MTINKKQKSIIAQTCVLLVFALLVYSIGATLNSNLSAKGIKLGFNYLLRPASFNMSETVLSYKPGQDSFWWAAVVGLGNTLYLSLIVVLLSTVLGTFVAIGRLSSNVLASRLCQVWVEIARNTPPIILLFLIYSLWWQILPPIEQAIEVFPNAYISLRGFVFPDLQINTSKYAYWLSLLACVAFVVIRRYMRLKSGKPGLIFKEFLYTIAFVFVAFGAFVLMFGASPQINIPTFSNGLIDGGKEISPEFTSIVVGLTIYTTGFIAEIVRAGILAIHKGQWEAGRAVGLSNAKILQLIILPQTLRVILPPMTSQYINVIKNSTLAIAIGYMDFLTVMQTIINITSHAVEGLLIILAVYLLVNLGLSALMNRWNNKLLSKTSR